MSIEEKAYTGIDGTLKAEISMMLITLNVILKNIEITNCLATTEEVEDVIRKLQDAPMIFGHEIGVRK